MTEKTPGKRPRRTFTPEYKHEAARLVIDTGRSIAEVAREWGVGSQSLGKWVAVGRAEQAGESTGELSLDERAELKALRRQVVELHKDNEFLGKGSRLLRHQATTYERYGLMAAQKANFQVTRMVRLLVVSRSGFYAWVARHAGQPGSQRRARDHLDAKVRKVFDDSDEVYGSPRVHAQLAREGFEVDRKTVARSMCRQGLKGISPKKFTPVTTIPGVTTYTIPDLVKRCWDWGGINRVWISDITYLRTGEGWLYLAAVTDAHSRRILGWVMDSRMGTFLVEKALRRAHTLRGEVPDGVVFHADRGSEFSSDDMFKVYRGLEMLQSVGRTGVCWDNAMAESVWATMKIEFYDRRKWPTRAEARLKFGDWIESRYNHRRLHSALGYLPPVKFEMNLLNIPAVETPTAA
ncbi:IS3 family transposase [Corynebacteriaceae bacterium 7-707]